MIELEQLEAMFSNVASKAKWDMSKPMLWGYFFTNKSQEKLKSLIPLLNQEGCRFVDLYIPDLDEGEEPYFFLHVEKEEVHSPASLRARNIEFYALADRLEIDSYDGMDVGPIQQ